MQKIKELRDQTGLSFGEIKKALDQAGGNQEKAFEALKSFGAALAAKKSSRQVKSGIVDAYIHTNKKVGALVELLCETDFVAKNEEFLGLARDLAMQIAAMKPVTPEDLFAQTFIKDPSVTVQQLIERAVGKLGENIQVGRFSLFEI